MIFNSVVVNPFNLLSYWEGAVSGEDQHLRAQGLHHLIDLKFVTFQLLIQDDYKYKISCNSTVLSLKIRRLKDYILTRGMNKSLQSVIHLGNRVINIKISFITQK